MLSSAPSLRLQSSIVGVLCAGLALLVAAPPASAQDSEPSKQEKLMHYSLYYENYKNDNFESARSDLLWVLENAPGVPDGDDDNYRRVIRLYEGLAEQASDEETRKAHLDTAATHLASAVEKIDQDGLEYTPYKWERRKGRFLEKYQGSLPNDVEGLETPTAHYRKAFELAPKELNAYYIQQILQSHLENNDLQQALDFANTVES
ncbi:MAG: hypothetical protein V5A20_04410, partial [Salinibacter sp.]